jgi:hypothetical protein
VSIATSSLRAGCAHSATVEVHLHPFGFEKLTWAHGHERREEEGTAAEERAFVGWDVAKQLADGLGDGDGRVMPRRHRPQGATEIAEGSRSARPVAMA